MIVLFPVRAFACPVCRQQVFFDNTACLRCGAELAYRPAIGAIDQIRPPLRRCGNFGAIGCNWALEGDDREDRCRACRLTRTHPEPGDSQGRRDWAEAEAAKRYVLHQLEGLGIPFTPRQRDPAHGLVFDLLAGEGVMTGHDDGVITLDLGEVDDAHRAEVRRQMGEAYRTILGHFRHEIGHYVFTALVEDGGEAALAEVRSLFGDERANYGEALERHYRDGPPADWARRYVSAYATMHPYEDWAETFAHYLHITDTLESAATWGLIVAGPDEPPPGMNLTARPALATGDRSFAAVVREEWIPLTFALNAVNRSMGRGDLYPFILSAAVIDKLEFVHGRVNTRIGRFRTPSS